MSSRRSWLVALAAGSLLAAALISPSIAATKAQKQAWRFVKKKLSAVSVINAAGNPVDWSQLKNVPEGLADGEDAFGTPGSGDISGVEAGDGLNGGGTSGDVTLDVDFTETQKRVTGGCIAGSHIESINANGGAACARSVYFASAVGADFFPTMSTAFTALPGATATLLLPTGFYTIVATFSAESYCDGGNGWCSVKLLAGGVEMAPAVGLNYAFDYDQTGDDDWYEGHSMQRLSTGNYSGLVPITVQLAVLDSNTFFEIDDWVLTVQAIPTDPI